MVDPGEFVGGGVLGTALSLLCDAIIELIRMNHMFSPLLIEIQSSLKSLEQLIPQMSWSNQQLPYAKPDELQGLEAVLNDGKVIVAKCKTLSEWNYLRRYWYANKLIEWKEKFEKQSRVVFMQGLRDLKMTAVGVQKIEGLVGNVMEELKNIKENSGIQDQSAVFKAWSAIPQPPLHPVGLDVRLKEFKKEVFQDGESMFVVTAFGGCGKTTLVSKFCRDQDVKDFFNDNIFFVIISEDPKMEVIVKQLYEQKHMKAPDFPSKQSAEILLDNFLIEVGKNPLLVVLDDVRPGSESLLAKFDLRMSNYKVLVTSRSRLKGFGVKHDVLILDDGNAMELFSHSASLADESSHISEDLARQIVQRCGGNPLAIKVVGESLRGQPDAFWNRRLTKWSKGSSIFDDTSQLLSRLQSSIDELDKETRKCFLDLGSFPQKKFIPVATLFDMWAELYDIDDDINECIVNLYELSTRSLANLVHTTREVNMEHDGYYSQHFVIQHDLLRELAIYLSKKDKEEKGGERLMIEICGHKLPKWWSEPESQTIQARLLSISTDGKFAMKWPNIELPKAKVLILNFQTQDYVFPPFVKKMHELKVLAVTCDGLFVSGAALSSFQLLNLLSNLKTIILEGISIPSVIKNPILLKTVKKISLSRCYEVSEAFRDNSVKISKVFPKLVVLNIDFCNLVELPADLGHLKFLEELNITNCCGLSTLPEGVEKLVNLEVLRLRFCRDFLKFPHSIKLKRLKTLDLAYCSSMEELPKYIGELSSLTKLDTRKCSALNELPPSISDLKQLEVVICSYKTKLLTEALPHGKNVPMVPKNLSWDDFNE